MNQTALGIGVIVAMLLGVFAVFFGPPLLREIRTREVLAHGTPAEARITDLVDTGNRYNNQPEIAIHLEVMPAGKPPFAAVVKRVLTVADMDFFARGRTIAVKYDPAHPDRVAIVGQKP